MEMLAAMTEAVLFAAGEPIETSRIAQVLEIPESGVPPLMEQLHTHYAQTHSALQVMKLGHAWQLGTREQFAAVIRKALEQERMRPLTNAAMEALTIIAYNQPASKGFVERVRGIDSSSVINSLVDKGLLEEAGRIDVPGHPIGYRTTPLFLRAFGLHSLDDLPEPREKQTAEFVGELEGYAAGQPAVIQEASPEETETPEAQA